jgi:nucleoside-diphosphate kinase
MAFNGRLDARVTTTRKDSQLDQKTYIMLKPDAVAGRKIGRIVSRFEDTGLTIERMELAQVTAEQAAENYREHAGKPFYDGLISYITSGPVVKLVISGPNAVAVCRKLMGATNPAEAAPGTIRGDFGLIMDANVVHGSDSPESAEREIAIFFS